MIYRFIRDHQQEFAVVVMCRVLGVSRSGYYAWQSRPMSERERSNSHLVKEIRAVYAKSRQTYGSPRVFAELRANGVACGRHRVARLMRQDGIYSQRKRRFKTTTNSQHIRSVAPNLLQQQFVAERTNQTWLADITYVPTDEGWLYLAAVIDLYSRRIVGWAMKTHLTDDLAIDALRMALLQRQYPQHLIHHSDRGSQYASLDYQTLIKDHRISPSMSSTGNCFDNAPMESFFATLKLELIHRCHYETRAEAQLDIFEYIEVFYNRLRRHSSLRYLSPVDFEMSSSIP